MSFDFIKSLLKAVWHRSLKRGKYLAVFRVLYDWQYFRDVVALHKELYELGPVVARSRVRVRLSALRHSHTPTYTGWVDELAGRYSESVGLPPPPECFRDRNGSLKVSDGNHRLFGMRRAYPAEGEVTVFVLHRERDKMPPPNRAEPFTELDRA